MMTNSSAPYKKILVLGAGELGMAILQGLVSKKATHPDIQVSVLLRAASSAPRDVLSDWGVQTVEGDLANQSIEELASTFQPFDAVIGCSGFAGGLGTQLKITQACLAAKIRRYIPWQFGVDYETIGYGSGQQTWDEQLQVRELLQSQSDTNWLIVSTGMFTSYLFEPSFGVIDFDARTVRALGDWEHRVTVTTPEDIGALTAEVFFAEPLLDNTVVFVAGDTLSYRELHSLVEECEEQTFRAELLDQAALHDFVEKNPDDTAGKYRLAFARPDGVAWDFDRTFNGARGIKTQTARDWLTKHHRREATSSAK